MSDVLSELKLSPISGIRLLVANSKRFGGWVASSTLRTYTHIRLHFLSLSRKTVRSLRSVENSLPDSSASIHTNNTDDERQSVWDGIRESLRNALRASEPSTTIERRHSSDSSYTTSTEPEIGKGSLPVRPQPGTPKTNKMAELLPKLKMMEEQRVLVAHPMPIRYLQFSFDGRYLATSR